MDVGHDRLALTPTRRIEQHAAGAAADIEVAHQRAHPCLLLCRRHDQRLVQAAALCSTWQEVDDEGRVQLLAASFDTCPGWNRWARQSGPAQDIACGEADMVRWVRAR